MKAKLFDFFKKEEIKEKIIASYEFGKNYSSKFNYVDVSRYNIENDKIILNFNVIVMEKRFIPKDIPDNIFYREQFVKHSFDYNSFVIKRIVIKNKLTNEFFILKNNSNKASELVEKIMCS